MKPVGVELGLQTIHDSTAAFIRRGYGPVSYTHLDVYKRQPFSRRGTAAADKQFTFRLPPEHVSMFQELGIDIVTLANNHALDFGTDALLDTCSTLDDAGRCV